MVVISFFREFKENKGGFLRNMAVLSTLFVEELTQEILMSLSLSRLRISVLKMSSLL